MHTIPESVLSEITRLIASILPDPGWIVTRYDEPADDEVYTSEDEALEAIPAPGKGYGVAPVSIQLTIGYSPDSQTWGFQTGDNSFTGGAYGHPVWGVAYLSADSDPAEVAQEIVDDIESQLADMA